MPCRLVYAAPRKTGKVLTTQERKVGRLGAVLPSCQYGRFARSLPHLWASVLLHFIVVLSNGDCALIDLDPALVQSQLEWQPFTRFNYSVPSDGKYCSHPQCLRCSDPEEWDMHPYDVCEVVPSLVNASHERLVLEVATAPFDFQSLLVCFAGPNVTLSTESVQVDSIREGGLLYDSGGSTVHPPSADNPTRIFLEASEGAGEHLGHRAVEVGRLPDFLAYDSYFARSFLYKRYDNFLRWEHTRELAPRLFDRQLPNCLLLSSTKWKRKTRYEISLTLLHTGQVESAALGGVWMAPLAYEVETLPPEGRSEDDDLEVDFPGIISHSDAGFLHLSVRGHKGGAVCSVVQNRSLGARAAPCGLGHVPSKRNGHCIFCPLLDDAARDEECAAALEPASWAAWTNDGERGGPQDCCPPNTFPQLVGMKACGAPISPAAVDIDLSHLDFDAAGALPTRLCERYSRIREIFVRSYCDFKCAQSGNVLSELCVCEIEFQKNASWVTDVYMAREVLRDFLYEGRALWDQHALDKARRVVRRQGLDLDKRRLTNPTRLRGLQNIWGRGAAGRRGEFEDYYNGFIEFQADPDLSLQDQKGSVQDTDTLFLAEVNIRVMGVLLADPSLSPSPVRCVGLYDPFAEGADEGLLHGARDPYWPLYGHPPDEF